MTEGVENKAQVLLVEDNLTDATFVRTLLEKDGDVRVTLAQDGIRGCQLAENNRWDMVVADLNLPGRDGIEVILACAKSQPDTPIIALSAYPGSASRDGAIRAGASEFLDKPLDGQELMTIARNLLRLKSEGDSNSRIVLAVGAFPGDVEVGCGGTLMKHALRGDQVQVLVISLGKEGPGAQDRALATQRACRIVGAQLHLPPEDTPEVPDSDTVLIRVKDAVHELEPDLVYAPSFHDVRESRHQVFTAAEISADEATSLLCYQAATTTLEFRPTHFEDVSDFLDQKMAALTHFQHHAEGRPHLHPGLARATAQYWGRFLGYADVEPFEVIRQRL
ncbi:MAG: response regulator [Gemmatimonadota bacterium]|jgi:CheY-like chemotaxis protein